MTKLARIPLFSWALGALTLTALLAQVRPDGPIAATGGVARNRALLEAIAARVGHPVRATPDPQLVGALGAALSVGD
jgi:activator of 2-hydroxyglutaryl-CoA dehydratase